MAKRPTTRSKDTAAAAPEKPKSKRARGVTAVPATPPPETPVETAAQNREQLGSAPDAAGAEPSADDIRRRAYERYLERGGNHGQHFDDWLEAERELRTKK
jgi:hypothetical protein